MMKRILEWGQGLTIDNHYLPEGDRIYDLYTGAYKPHIIRIALGLDVFTRLDGRPTTAELVARACKCDTLGMTHLLDYLASLKVLMKKGDLYGLSAEAATFLVRGKKSYVGNLLMDFIGSEPWNSIKESIQSGEPKNIDLEIHFTQDAWIESYRSVRIPSSLEMWKKVGIIADKTLQLELLDLACGCAIKSMVLAQKSKKVKLTCLDTPKVLDVARDLAQRWGIAKQVTFIPGNLLATDLGNLRYDGCLLGQVTHYLTKQHNCQLFKRICSALIHGGKLVLDVPMETTELDENSSFLSLLLWANSGGRAYSFEEYRSWLMDSGFIQVDKLSERLLVATSN
jgi:SAM-dependent methyltransferase